MTSVIKRQDIWGSGSAHLLPSLASNKPLAHHVEKVSTAYHFRRWARGCHGAEEFDQRPQRAILGFPMPCRDHEIEALRKAASGGVDGVKDMRHSPGDPPGGICFTDGACVPSCFELSGLLLTFELAPLPKVFIPLTLALDQSIPAPCAETAKGQGKLSAVAK